MDWNIILFAGFLVIQAFIFAVAAYLGYRKKQLALTLNLAHKAARLLDSGIRSGQIYFPAYFNDPNVKWDDWSLMILRQIAKVDPSFPIQSVDQTAVVAEVTKAAIQNGTIPPRIPASLI